MNIKRAKEEIKRTIAAYLMKNDLGEYRIPRIRQRPILLMGPPGIGKTQIMEQIASECDLALVSYTITHHTRQSAIGLPFIVTRTYGGKEQSVTEYTMSEIIASIYDTMAQSKKSEGILFIDEINCVSETLAPAMLQFLQCKSFGNRFVPDGWIIVAAGNPPEYNKSVRDFDVVTLDRVKQLPVEADLSVWREYARTVKIHDAILSYLELKPEHFYVIETSIDGTLFVTARGWEDLSEFLYLYEELHYTADREVIAQYLQHPAVSKSFANYLELYYKYRTDYQIERIFEGIIDNVTLSRLRFAPFDERLSVTGLLLSYLTKEIGSYIRMDAFLSRLFPMLKQLQVLFSRSTLTPSALVLTEAQQVRDDLELGLAAKNVTAAEKSVALKLIATLQNYSKELEKPEVTSENAFDYVRILFAADRDAREALYEKCQASLEYAFDFLEAAFGSGQELVYFITELLYSPDISAFLKEYHCTRFETYNQTLLFDDSHQQILRSLDEIDDRKAGKDMVMPTDN